MYILLVEDEKRLAGVIVKRLKEEGIKVDTVYDGLEAGDYILLGHYDAIVMDIMLPGVDGLTLLRRLRQAGNTTPVMLLTALGDVNSRVDGLDAGADDYLCKPFAYEELMARLRALLRRKSGSASNDMKVGDISIDIKMRKAYVKDAEITLSKREFDVLNMLMLNRDAVLTRAQIEDNVWRGEYDITSNIVDVYIRSLRKKLGDAQGQIRTVRGVGYSLHES
ncbi:MAG: response regulator transcription factor [Clostridia bacterium]|nr:response regulator transcription factor [Clostridia bacterium]